MAAQIPYHSGILVDDLGKAMAGLSGEISYEFNTPTTLTVPRFDDRIAGTEGPMELTVTYSRTGPHRLELIAAHGTGIYAAERIGLHHVGVWESDIARRLESLDADPLITVEAVLWRSTGEISAVYTTSTVTHTRIEYVNDDRREQLERWFDTGSF